MGSYFIKEGYRVNTANITNDKVSHGNYWDSGRLMASSLYQFPVYSFLSDYIDRNSIEQLIDIGCGAGKKLEFLNKKNRNLSIVGIDQSHPIEYCRSNYSFGEWLVDDFDDPEDSKVVKSKLVISSDVIEHLVDPDLLLNYVKSKLKKGGVAVFSTPERDLLRGEKCNYSPNPHHIREWNYTEFEEYLEDRGFEILDHFLQYPIKFGVNRYFFNEIVKRALKMKPLKYNQVVVAKVL